MPDGNKPAVYIDGDSGTTGLQIVQRLGQREDIELLTQGAERRRDVAARTELLNEADVVILCLPDETAVEAVTLVKNERVRIIDASTAHRVAPGWVYGMPEYDEGRPEAIAEAGRVSNPGCYAMGAISLLAPLVRAGLLPSDHVATVLGVSGYSGGGKSLIKEFEEQPDAATSPFYVYGLTQTHKHLEEMRIHSLLANSPSFVPNVGRFRQGMVVSVPLQAGQLSKKATLSDILEILGQAYENRRFVQVRADDEGVDGATRIDPSAFAGTNHMELAVYGDATNRRFLLTAAYDNLGKGASGTAVQNLNLMLGMPEDVGLEGPALSTAEFVAAN